MSCAIPPDILDKFTSVLQCGGEAEEAIRQLGNPTKEDYFRNFILRKMKRISRVESHTSVPPHTALVYTPPDYGSVGVEVNRIEPKQFAGDHTAQAYKTLAGDMYKCVPVYSDLSIRNIFMEIFIQIVLSSDTTRNAASICNIKRVYYDEDPRTYKGYILFLKLDMIPKNIEDVLTGATFEQITSVLRGIHEPLLYFRRKYNFHHCDLHAGNILFTADNKPVLIDFGDACITFCGRTYATSPLYKPRKPEHGCESADMLMYVGALIVGSVDLNFNSETVGKLRTLAPAKFTERVDQYERDVDAWKIAVRAWKNDDPDYPPDRPEDPRMLLYPYMLRDPTVWEDQSVAVDILTNYDRNFAARLGEAARFVGTAATGTAATGTAATGTAATGTAATGTAAEGGKRQERRSASRKKSSRTTRKRRTRINKK